jgi:two-component system C4-dicarboxylate transport response regulator DctD
MEPTEALSVVLIEDDSTVRLDVAQALRLEGMEVTAFDAAEPAMAWLPEDFCGVVVTDVKLPGMDGMGLLQRVMRSAPACR